VPPLFDHLVDDTSLLAPRSAAPEVGAVVARYLAARDGRHGGLRGQLVCPVSRLPVLVRELARRAPARPVDVSLVVDTGLGAVPKALSTVFSRSNLLTPRTIETAAPVDVDAVWLERVAEFVPDDVVAVVEPLRPVGGDETATDAWLDAVRRVAGHGCTPKLRCGGPRLSDVPSVAEVEHFVRVVVEAKGVGASPRSAGEERTPPGSRPFDGAAKGGFVALGLRSVSGVDGAGSGSAAGPHRHGVLNLLVAVARAQSGGDVAAALAGTDGAALAQEALALGPAQVTEVRGLLARCGADAEPDPADELAGLGLLG
jgi:hypothetical protein